MTKYSINYKAVKVPLAFFPLPKSNAGILAVTIIYS